MKIYKKIKQGTDEWFRTRAGKMTASNAQCIQAKGKGLETYIYKTLAEKYSKNIKSYSNEDMQRGIELEPQARGTYQIETGRVVKEVGFIEMDEYTGCSPDGLADKTGLVEIKCPDDANYFKLLANRDNLKGLINKAYVWQMQMQMLVAEKDWCDFVAYNPNFETNLIICTFKKDLMMQEKLIVGIEAGKKLIKEIELKINQQKNGTKKV